VPAIQLSHYSFDRKPPQSPKGKDGVEVGTLWVGGIVGVAPGKSASVTGDLAIGTITGRIVYVKALIFRQMYATGGDKRQTALT
jgi:hypothetical protein